MDYNKNALKKRFLSCHVITGYIIEGIGYIVFHMTKLSHYISDFDPLFSCSPLSPVHLFVKRDLGCSFVLNGLFVFVVVVVVVVVF